MERKEEHAGSPSMANGGSDGARTSSLRRLPVGGSAMNSSTRRILNQLNASTTSNDGRMMLTGSQELLARAFNGNPTLNDSNSPVIREIDTDADRDVTTRLGTLTIGIQTLPNLLNSVTDLTKTVESAMSTIAAQNGLLVQAMKDQQQIIADQRASIASNQETIAQYNKDLITQNKDLINQNRDLETKFRDVSQQALNIAKERYNAEARALAAQQSLAAAQQAAVPVVAHTHPQAPAAASGYVNPYVYNQISQTTPAVGTAAGAFWSVNSTASAVNPGAYGYAASTQQQQQMQAAPAQAAVTQPSNSQYQTQQTYQTPQQQSQLQSLLRQDTVPTAPQQQTQQAAPSTYQPPLNRMEYLLQNQFNQTQPATAEQVKQWSAQNPSVQTSGAQGSVVDSTTKSTIASILKPVQPAVSEIQQKSKESVTISTAPIKSSFSFLSTGTNASTPSGTPVNLSFSSSSVSKQDSTKSPAGQAPSPLGAGRNKTASESDGEDHFEPAVDFKPVIPLPDIVEVVTGEEEEEALFSHRAKLYRWNAELKEFKERGLGDIKILKHRQNKKVRIVMRREQVHKICANHFLSSEMVLKPMTKSEVAWTWSCYDFSEDEPSSETLAVRFKTKDIAEDFRKIFEKGVKDMSELKGDSPKKSEDTTEASKTTTTGWGDKFTKKPGSWTCDGCMVTNGAEITTCPCCGTGKDGKPASKPVGFTSNTSSEPPKPSGFSFGIPAKTDDTKPKSGLLKTPQDKPKQTGIFGSQDSKTSTASSGFSLGGFSFSSKPIVETKPEPSKSETTKPAAASDAKPASSFKGFSFGAAPSPPKTDTPPVKPAVSAPSKVFGIGTDTSNLSFSALATTESPPAFQSTGKGFPGQGTKLFGTGTPANSSRQKNASESDGEDQFEPNVDFKPVVPLPNLVEVVTGEEEEEVLFSHRAKLYRWVVELKEFKERGLGDIKILKHRENKKVRIVMRREQVHKICANHFLTPEMELKPMAKSELAWTWSCYDFTEDEPSTETLAIRFKTKETAEEFRKIFEAGVREMQGIKGTPPKKSESTVSQAEPTPVENGSSGKATVTLGFGEKPAAKPSLFGTSSTSGFGTGSTAGGFSFGGGSSSANTSQSKSSEGSPAFGGFSFKTGASTKDTNSTPKSTSSSLSGFSFALGKKPTDESNLSDAEKVTKYQLPGEFFTETSSCKGCMGCGTDEDQDKVIDALDIVATTPESNDEEQCLWEAQATLEQSNQKKSTVGSIKFLYDTDLSGYRIIFLTSAGETIVNHLVCKGHKLTEEQGGRGRVKLSWKALNYAGDSPIQKTFTITLSSPAKAKEFSDHFAEGILAAENNSIEETAPIRRPGGGEWNKASEYKSLLSSLMKDPMPRKVQEE